MKTIKISILILFIIGIKSFAQESVNLETSPNFRSLSGIENNKGKKIKPRIIYRSGNFSKLTDSDLAKFNALKINTVIDFRNDGEIAKDPDFVAAVHNLNNKRATIGSINDKEMGGFMKVLANPNFDEAALDSLMIMANSGFVKSIKDFKPFFDELSDEKSVVLFHCTAGKDRTGFASALFLHILDVSDEEIMKDYLRSNEAIAKTDLNKYSSYGIPAERMAKLMGVKSQYLEAALKASIEKYGSIGKMLLAEFGIDEKVKKKIQKKYLMK